MNKSKNPVKQFEQLLSEITTWYVKQTVHASEKTENAVTAVEIENYQRLLQNFRKNQLSDNDLIHIQEDYNSLPREIHEQFKRIDAIDCYQFEDGIDTESCAYKYYNALN